MIPQKFIDQQHKLHDKVCNDAVYAEVSKGMYGLPQAGRIANDRLVEHLGECGYKPVPRMAGLWKHERLGNCHSRSQWTTLASNVKTKD